MVDRNPQTKTTSTKITSRNLPVKLTPDELLRIGGELAEAVQDIDAEEDRQGDLKAGMKARLAELEARRTQLAVKIARQEEYRDVRVTIHYDHQRGIVEEIRDDLGEVITTRQMTDSERQLMLPTD